MPVSLRTIANNMLLMTGSMVLIALLLLASLSARAQEDATPRWIPSSIRETARQQCEWWGNCAQHYKNLYWRERRRHAAYERQQRHTRVYGYAKHLEHLDKRDAREERDVCLNIRRATGDERLSKDTAMDAASRALATQIEFHEGSKFADLSLADGVRYACVTKQRNSWMGKAQEALGQQHYVCEIEARPCRAEKTEAK